MKSPNTHTFDPLTITPNQNIHIIGNEKCGKRYLEISIRGLLNKKHIGDEFSLIEYYEKYKKIGYYYNYPMDIFNQDNDGNNFVQTLNSFHLELLNNINYLKSILSKKEYTNTIFRDYLYWYLYLGTGDLIDDFDIIFLSNSIKKEPKRKILELNDTIIESPIELKTRICKKYISHLSQTDMDIINNYNDKYGFIVIQHNKPLLTYTPENTNTLPILYNNNNLNQKFIEVLLNKITNGYSMFYDSENNFKHILQNQVSQISNIYHILFVLNNINMFLPTDVNRYIIKLITILTSQNLFI